jgi:hypothetical protein
MQEFTALKLHNVPLATAGERSEINLTRGRSTRSRFQDRLIGRGVSDDLHVAVFEPHCLIGPKASVCHEQHEVVELLALPLIAIIFGMLRTSTRCLVKLAVLIRRKPPAMYDLRRSFIWRRQIGNSVYPSVPNAHFNTCRRATISFCIVLREGGLPLRLFVCRSTR